ncbi:MAG: restriction endonuclease [Butyrivibrio sp.]|nr:restriction endonuclease [Butyrivibrio sp.]
MDEKYSLKQKHDPSGAYVANILVIALIFFSVYAFINRNVLSPFVSMVIIYIMMYFIFISLTTYFKSKRQYSGPMSLIDEMSSEEFVAWLKVFFEHNGFVVKQTQKDPKFGVSLIMVKKTEYKRVHPETYIVQARRYTSDVDVDGVKKALAAQRFYETDRCIICTNQYYTEDAYALARQKGVVLMNRDHVYKIKMQEVA